MNGDIWLVPGPSQQQRRLVRRCHSLSLGPRLSPGTFCFQETPEGFRRLTCSAEDWVYLCLEPLVTLFGWLTVWRACMMLSAVKMEGHEHGTDWSGGGYYGEPEVRAPFTGLRLSWAPLIIRGVISLQGLLILWSGIIEKKITKPDVIIYVYIFMNLNYCCFFKSTSTNLDPCFHSLHGWFAILHIGYPSVGFI